MENENVKAKVVAGELAITLLYNDWVGMDPCAICGSNSVNDDGSGLWWVIEPIEQGVCLDCATLYAPDVVRLRKMFMDWLSARLDVLIDEGLFNAEYKSSLLYR